MIDIEKAVGFLFIVAAVLLLLGFFVGRSSMAQENQKEQELSRLEQVEKDLKETREAIQSIGIYLQSRGSH